MRHRLLVILAVVFFGSVKLVNAEIVFSDFASGFRYTHTWAQIDADSTLADQFTPADTVTFDDAVVANWGSEIISLFSDLSGKPGSAIEQISVAPGTNGGVGFVTTASSVLHPTLTSGTPYWLVVSSNTGGGWYQNARFIGLDDLFNTATAATSSGPWQVQRVPAMDLAAFQIDGTAVPEPSTLTLLALGSLGFLIRKRK